MEIVTLDHQVYLELIGLPIMYSKKKQYPRKSLKYG